MRQSTFNKSFLLLFLVLSFLTSSTYAYGAKIRHKKRLYHKITGELRDTSTPPSRFNSSYPVDNKNQLSCLNQYLQGSSMPQQKQDDISPDRLNELKEKRAKIENRRERDDLDKYEFNIRNVIRDDPGNRIASALITFLSNNRDGKFDFNNYYDVCEPDEVKGINSSRVKPGIDIASLPWLTFCNDKADDRRRADKWMQMKKNPRRAYFMICEDPDFQKPDRQFSDSVSFELSKCTEALLNYSDAAQKHLIAAKEKEDIDNELRQAEEGTQAGVCVSCLKIQEHNNCSH